MKWIKNIISTKLFRSLVLMGLKVLVKRSDNKIDDKIFNEVEKYSKINK